MQVQLAASILSSLFTFHSIWKLLTIIEQKSKIAQNLYYKNPSVSLVAATSLEREAFIVFNLPKPPLLGEVPERRKDLMSLKQNDKFPTTK